MEGTPFIDDYISTQEQVVDYVTKVSCLNFCKRQLLLKYLHNTISKIWIYGTPIFANFPLILLVAWKMSERLELSVHDRTIVQRKENKGPRL